MKLKLSKTAFIPKKADKALIIDADVFVFQAVVDAQQERLINDEYQYVVDRISVENAISTRIHDTIRELGAREIILCFGTKTNWRKKLMPEYKAHRTARKPLGYWATVEWCKKKWQWAQTEGLEADDLCGILMTGKKWNPNLDRVLVSEDKDLLTIPGLHWNPRHPDKGIFEVWPTDAVLNHMRQALVGDGADGYKGCPGVGLVKAEGWINKYPDDPWRGVVEAYNNAGLTEEDALLQARVAHILTWEYHDEATNTVKYWNPPRQRSMKLAGKK